MMEQDYQELSTVPVFDHVFHLNHKNQSSDNNGNRTEQRTPFDTVVYTYDALNRMSQVRTLRSLEGSVTEYFYNEVGNRDSVHNANGTATGYDYDDLNRLTKVTNFAPDQSVISKRPQILPPLNYTMPPETNDMQEYSSPCCNEGIKVKLSGSDNVLFCFRCGSKHPLKKS